MFAIFVDFSGMSLVPTVFLIDQAGRPMSSFDFANLSTRGIFTVAASAIVLTVLATKGASFGFAALLGSLNGNEVVSIPWDRSFKLAHLLFTGFFATVVFKRWSRSSKGRSHSIIFSRVLTVTEIDGKKWYGFKVVDCDAQNLGGVKVTVRLLCDNELTDVSAVQVSGHTGLVMPAFVSFCLDRASVCDVCGKDLLMTSRLALHASAEGHMQRSRIRSMSEWEVLVTVSGMDSFTNKPVVAYHRYSSKSDVVLEKFANREISRGKDGYINIDFEKFDDLNGK